MGASLKVLDPATGAVSVDIRDLAGVTNAIRHEGDIVWRLPPTLATSRDNPELRAELEAVGESNRMTLKFRKPD